MSEHQLCWPANSTIGLEYEVVGWLLGKPSNRPSRPGQTQLIKLPFLQRNQFTIKMLVKYSRAIDNPIDQRHLLIICKTSMTKWTWKLTVAVDPKGGWLTAGIVQINGELKFGIHPCLFERAFNGHMTGDVNERKLPHDQIRCRDDCRDDDDNDDEVCMHCNIIYPCSHICTTQELLLPTPTPIQNRTNSFRAADTSSTIPLVGGSRQNLRQRSPPSSPVRPAAQRRRVEPEVLEIESSSEVSVYLTQFATLTLYTGGSR